MLVMEYICNGDLYSFLEQRGRVQECEARKYFTQLLEALNYCHMNSVVHRDIKLENVLLDKDFNVKLADFGLSNLMEDGKFLKTSCGSPDYAAPEVISNTNYCGPPVDVWGCGVLLYALVSAALPFDEPNYADLFNCIRNADYTTPFYFSGELKDLVARILNPDPVSRATIKQIFKHPWVTAGYSLQKPTVLPLDYHRTIDEEVFERCLSYEEFALLGECKENLRRKIHQHRENSFVVAYELLLDAKMRRLSKQQRQEQDKKMVSEREAFAPTATSSSGYQPSSAGSLNSPSHADELPEDFIKQGTPWVTGLQTGGDTDSLLLAVAQRLRPLGFEWKLTEGSSIRIRSTDWKAKRLLKFQCNCFYAEEDSVMDFQLVEGSQFALFDVVAKLHTLLNN